MHQPPGFCDNRFPNHVCRLKKALYGLKQAPRVWYHRFAHFLSTLGFHHSRCDNSLFIYNHGRDIAYLLLYVDDIVLTASSESLRRVIFSRLSKEFAMKDLGPLSYFLGILVEQNASGLFLSEQKYAKEIMERAHMASCNSTSTPVDTGCKLSASSRPPVKDPTLYRSLAGALQYLTFTRPNISYAVQQIMRYTALFSTYGALFILAFIFASPIRKILWLIPMRIGVGVRIPVGPHQDIVFSWVTACYHGLQNVNRQYPVPLLRLSIAGLQMLCQKRVGYVICVWNYIAR